METVVLFSFRIEHETYNTLASTKILFPNYAAPCRAFVGKQNKCMVICITKQRKLTTQYVRLD